MRHGAHETSSAASLIWKAIQQAADGGDTKREESRRRRLGEDVQVRTTLVVYYTNIQLCLNLNMRCA